MTSIENSTETLEILWLVASDAWTAGGTANVTAEEHAAACERAEQWLTEHEGDDYSVTVRPAGREHDGLYLLARGQNGERRSLRHEGDVPYAEVRELTGSAWEHALKTWPRT